MICNVSGITVLAHKMNPNKIDTYFQHGSSMMFTPLHPGFQLNNPLNLCKQVVVHNIIICRETPIHPWRPPRRYFARRNPGRWPPEGARGGRGAGRGKTEPR